MSRNDLFEPTKQSPLVAHSQFRLVDEMVAYCATAKPGERCSQPQPFLDLLLQRGGWATAEKIRGWK